mgnify:FL=1
MKTILAAAALSLALAGSAAAADAEGRYEVLGLGAFTCADYIAAPPEAADLVGIWVQGYATAMNQLLGDVRDVTGGRSDAQIAQEIWHVCKADPKLLMADAARAMIVKMAGLDTGPAAKKTAKADEGPALRR